MKRKYEAQLEAETVSKNKEDVSDVIEENRLKKRKTAAKVHFASGLCGVWLRGPVCVKYSGVRPTRAPLDLASLFTGQEKTTEVQILIWLV